MPSGRGYLGKSLISSSLASCWGGNLLRDLLIIKNLSLLSEVFSKPWGISVAMGMEPTTVRLG